MTDTTIETMVPRAEVLRIKRRWNDLQGTEHTLDLARAQLLHQVWSTRLQKEDQSLRAFVVSVLAEYPGRRTSMFVRYAVAFDAINDETVWAQIGGRGVVLLARLRPAQVRKVMTRVRASLRETHRSNVSAAHFRTLLRAAIGDAAYEAILTERRRPDIKLLRRELAALKQFVLSLLPRYPSLTNGMPAEVKHSLGLDLAPS